MRLQDVALAEFSNQLAEYRNNSSPLDCTREQVLVYMHTYWIPRHSLKEKPIAPKTVMIYLSHLLTHFHFLHRGTTYDELACEGNPCRSVDMSLYRKGFTWDSVAEGFMEQSAVPLTNGKYRTLLEYLWHQAHQAAAIRQLLTCLDLVCFQLMWVMTCLGHDCRKLRLDDFRDPTNLQRPSGELPFPQPGPQQAHPVGFHRVLSQLGTETYQGCWDHLYSYGLGTTLSPVPSEPLLSIAGPASFQRIRLAAQSVSISSSCCDRTTSASRTGP